MAILAAMTGMTVMRGGRRPLPRIEWGVDFEVHPTPLDPGREGGGPGELT